MSTPFPGMDPYLERPDLWPNVHSRLIVAVADDLAPRLRPRYYVSVEDRTCLVRPDELMFAARPDAMIVGETKPLYQPVALTAVSTPVAVELPMPDVVTSRFGGRYGMRDEE